MRKTRWGLGLATAGMVFTASHVLAQTGGSAAGSTSGGGSAMGESYDSPPGRAAASDSSATQSSALQGKVERLDRSKNTLTLSGSDKVLKVDESTVVTKNGVKATLDDVKKGDEARASYSGSGATVKAKSLEVGESSSGTGK